MRVLIAGGGTAGHINPGIAIAKYIQQKNNDAEILFVGTKRGLETSLVPREGFKIELIKVKGFRRKLSLDTFVSIKEMFQGIIEARRLIKSFKPDVVIGTGGYVCGPVVFNASMMKIPTVIHEQNALPGVTNRILSRFADAVAISFQESKKFFKSAKNLVYTGNPIRSEMLETDKASARAKLGKSKSDSIVVIFGGSRGAERLNDAVVEMLLDDYKEEDCDIIYATGESLFEGISKELASIQHQHLEVVPYIYNMADVMASADLVVSRAGAITISELTALGVPAIMIPSPYVTANHQEHNASALEEQGAAVVILEKNLNGRILYMQIMDLLRNREQLSKMARNSKKMGIVNATEKIYTIINDVIEAKKTKAH
ncbi:MAG TPA: undecaprenyldiphospho-muramoylpentapeptide beta-N-acetylglucosaminyltransferase [Clostridia bacterium]|nr:undecaprenyldiphospho-muramoylpentapeptide beta-N-acetylglucosaminyltransferase [Clostridia bacterium]